jgi:Recombinase zinc beta ribbon domain
METQDEDTRKQAESNGDSVVFEAVETVEGPSDPWRRKKLGPWLTDPADFKALGERMESRAHRRNAPPKQSAMLTSTLFCGVCGPKLYRSMSGQVQRKSRRQYYYCRKAGLGGCGLLLPLEEIDAAVNDAVMTNGHLPHMVTTITPGDDHSDEIAQVRLDIRELDPEGADFLELLTAMRAELARLRALPSSPAKVTRAPSGRTVGDVWMALNTADRRQWLIDRRWKIEASKGAEGVPLVTIEAGEYLAEISSLRNLTAAMAAA